MRNRGNYKAPCSRCPNHDTCDTLQIVQTVMYGSVFENCPDADYETEDDYKKADWPVEEVDG